MPFKSKLHPNNNKSRQGSGKATHWPTVGQKCQPERHDCRGLAKLNLPGTKSLEVRLIGFQFPLTKKKYRWHLSFAF